jgi:YD repeat-containing protein
MLLAYRLQFNADAAAEAPGSPAIAHYAPVTSPLQPALSARADGGYLATFPHGLQIAFDQAGRLEWTGRDKTHRVTYAKTRGLVSEIQGPEARITLHYDARGHLKEARSSQGGVATYRIDEAGRLISVVGSESGNMTFAYGSDSRLATVNLGDRKLIANTYDDKGRMLTQQTPQGTWRFAYDDRNGQVTVTGHDGKDTRYYYNGQKRLYAYGTSKDNMTYLNYDISGRILQIAVAALINDPSTGARPQFKVSEVVTPLPRKPEEKKEG